MNSPPQIGALLRSIHKAKSFEDLSAVARTIEAARITDEERRVAFDTLAGRRLYLARAALTP